MLQTCLQCGQETWSAACGDNDQSGANVTMITVHCCAVMILPILGKLPFRMLVA